MYYRDLEFLPLSNFDDSTSASLFFWKRSKIHRLRPRFVVVEFSQRYGITYLQGNTLLSSLCTAARSTSEKEILPTCLSRWSLWILPEEND